MLEWQTSWQPGDGIDHGRDPGDQDDDDGDRDRDAGAEGALAVVGAVLADVPTRTAQGITAKMLEWQTSWQPGDGIDLAKLMTLFAPLGYKKEEEKNVPGT
jgi:hypothetical protein